MKSGSVYCVDYRNKVFIINQSINKVFPINQLKIYWNVKIINIKKKTHSGEKFILFFIQLFFMHSFGKPL